VRGMKRAAVTVAAVMITAVGRDWGDVEAGEAELIASPRPQGTGPLPKSVVQVDLDTSVTDAGVSANAPEFGEPRASEGSPPPLGRMRMPAYAPS